MSTTTPSPDPTPDDVARGLAEIDLYVAGQAPSTPRLAPAIEPEDAAEIEGETKRVRQLRAQVAEARHLIELQEDDTPLILDTDKVRKRRRVSYEAARLHELAQDPAMRAYQALRVRRMLIAGAMVSLTLALAWSTAGVQKFAADGADPGAPAWIFAWLVEPFMSLALLVVVGARAYLGTRGKVLDHPTVVKIERLFLGLTATMNAWPYLPGIADRFSMASLVLHLLGPVVAVAVVTALPIILEAFSSLDHGLLPGPPTGPTYRANAALVERARDLIDAGELPEAPSATRIQRTLRCGMDDARAVRDALNHPTTH